MELKGKLILVQKKKLKSMHRKAIESSSRKVHTTKKLCRHFQDLCIKTHPLPPSLPALLVGKAGKGGESEGMSTPSHWFPSQMPAAARGLRKPGAPHSIQSPWWAAESQVLEPATLPLRVPVSRKLEPAVKPRYPV